MEFIEGYCWYKKKDLSNTLRSLEDKTIILFTF
jgi:hypothetical protein